MTPPFEQFGGPEQHPSVPAERPHGGEVPLRTSPPSTGDIEAEFSAFFRSDLIRLMRFLRLMGYDYDLAADAAAEAMTDLYQRWEKVEYPGAWVRRVAMRKAAGLVFKNAREGLLFEDLVLEAELEPAAPSSETIDRLDLEALFQSLPPRQRAIMAYRLDDYTPSEIAEMTDSTQATVRSQIRHAQRKLREQLERRYHTTY